MTKNRASEEASKKNRYTLIIKIGGIENEKRKFEDGTGYCR